MMMIVRGGDESKGDRYVRSFGGFKDIHVSLCNGAKYLVL